jgi:hypothetical protein
MIHTIEYGSNDGKSCLGYIHTSHPFGVGRDHFLPLDPYTPFAFSTVIKFLIHIPHITLGYDPTKSRIRYTQSHTFFVYSAITTSYRSTIELLSKCTAYTSSC